MLQYYKEFWLNYVNFSGRSRRAAYWYVVLMNVIIGFVAGIISAFIPVVMLLVWVYSLATLIPSIALCMRRLHDIGKSGVWILISFVPLVGAILLIVWFCKEGDAGNNAYGPDPKAAAF